MVVAHRLSCFIECGIFPAQRSNLCLLQWQPGSLPLGHQGSPICVFLNCGKTYIIFFFFTIKKTYNSMASSTFTILCNHHHCPFLGLFIIIPNRTVMSFFASLRGMQYLCSLTRDGARAPAVETQSPNPCTAREFPKLLCLLHAGFLQVGCPVPTIPTWIPSQYLSTLKSNATSSEKLTPIL